MDLDPTPMDRNWIAPTHVIVKVPLPQFAIHQVFSPDDVGYAQKVVLDTRLEIEKRPDSVPIAGSWVVCCHDPECGPVSKRGIFVNDICLYSENCLTLL